MGESIKGGETMGESQEIVDEVKRMRTRIKGLEQRAAEGADVGAQIKALEDRLTALEGKLKDESSVDFVDWDGD